MASKSLAILWDEVQGSCDLARVQQSLEAAGPLLVSDVLVLDGWSPLHFLCENRALSNATRAQGIALLVRLGVDCGAVDEVRCPLAVKTRNRTDPLRPITRRESTRTAGVRSTCSARTAVVPTSGDLT